MTDAFQEAIRAIYAASKPRMALWEYCTPQVITKLAHALPRTRGKPCGIRQLIRQRYCGVMTAMANAWTTFSFFFGESSFGGVKVVVSLLRRPFRSKPEYTVIWYVPLRSLIVAIVLAPPFLLACAITIPRRMKLHHFVKNRTFLLQKIQLSQKMENFATLRR